MKIKKIKNILILGIIVIGVLMVVNCVSYKNIINESYQRLENYNIKTINTEYGIMSFIDEGSGEAILISHGVFGGYDQGYDNLYDIFGNDYRKIAISRFGYPGSNLPSESTPSNQARVYLELLDELQIEKVFCLQYQQEVHLELDLH